MLWRSQQKMEKNILILIKNHWLTLKPYLKKNRLMTFRLASCLSYHQSNENHCCKVGQTG